MSVVCHTWRKEKQKDEYGMHFMDVDPKKNKNTQMFLRLAFTLALLSHIPACGTRSTA
jgi:hypothetical protein